jgi:hypothetical protein
MIHFGKSKRMLPQRCILIVATPRSLHRMSRICHEVLRTRPQEIVRSFAVFPQAFWLEPCHLQRHFHFLCRHGNDNQLKMAVTIDSSFEGGVGYYGKVSDALPSVSVLFLNCSTPPSCLIRVSGLWDVLITDSNE